MAGSKTLVVGLAIGVVAVIIGIWLYQSSSPNILQPIAPPLTLLEREIGYFKDVVAVVRANKRGFTMKALIYGKSVLGGIWEVADNPSVFTVFDLMDLPIYSPYSKQHALIIGLGIGNAVKVFNKFSIVSDVVEIDPVVVEFARKYFGFATEGEVHTEDALMYLGGDLGNKLGYYDIVVHDVFSGSVEARLYTSDILKKIDSLLNHNGILVLNYVGKKDSPATLSVFRTLSAIWEHVRCFTDVLKEDENYPIGNLVFFASHKKITFGTPAPEPGLHKYSRLWMQSHHAELEVFFESGLVERDGIIVTGHNCAVVALDAEFKEYFGKTMLDLFTEKEWEYILRVE